MRYGITVVPRLVLAALAVAVLAETAQPTKLRVHVRVDPADVQRTDAVDGVTGELVDVLGNRWCERVDARGDADATVTVLSATLSDSDVRITVGVGDRADDVGGARAMNSLLGHLERVHGRARARLEVRDLGESHVLDVARSGFDLENRGKPEDYWRGLALALEDEIESFARAHRDRIHALRGVSSEPFPAAVKANTAIYEAPSLSSKVVVRLKTGARVSVLRPSEGSFWEIEADDRRGYVHEAKLDWAGR